MQKKLWLIVVGLLVLSASAFANPVQIGGANWIDIGVADDGTVIACNKDGDLYISRDIGKTWNQVVGATAIRVSINSDGTILGHIGKDTALYISRDKGATWTKTTASLLVDLCITRSIHFITNAKGEVYASTDLATWTLTKAVNEVRAVFDGWKLLTVSRTGGKAYTFAYKAPDMMPDYTTNGSEFVDIDIDPKGVMFAANIRGELYTAPDTFEAQWTRMSELSDAIAVSASAKYLVIVNIRGEAYLLTR